MLLKRSMEFLWNFRTFFCSKFQVQQSERKLSLKKYIFFLSKNRKNLAFSIRSRGNVSALGLYRSKIWYFLEILSAHFWNWNSKSKILTLSVFWSISTPSWFRFNWTFSAILKKKSKIRFRFYIKFFQLSRTKKIKKMQRKKKFDYYRCRFLIF